MHSPMAAAISDQLSVSSGAAMTTLIFHSFSCAFQLSTCLVVTCYLWHCFNVIHQIPAQHSSPFCYLPTLQNPEEKKKLSTCLFVFCHFSSTFFPFFFFFFFFLLIFFIGPTERKQGDVRGLLYSGQPFKATMRGSGS